MLAVIFYGLEVVYGVRERRLSLSDFFWDCITRDAKELLIFRFGHWGMFTALAHGTSDLLA